MRQLPQGTILIEYTDNSSISCDIEYFESNYEKISGGYSIENNKITFRRNNMHEVKNIFYKVYGTRDSWIDYKKAIAKKTGNKELRVRTAYKDPKFKIDFQSIPETVYFYSDGSLETVARFDGYYEPTLYGKRDMNKISLDSYNIAYKSSLGSDYIYYEWVGEDLVVFFPFSITNSLISLNMLFLPYDIIDENTIHYTNIKSISPKTTGFYNSSKVYRLDFNIYQWENVTIDDITGYPLEINENKFIRNANNPLNENDTIIFYNGVLYEFECEGNTTSLFFKFKDLDVSLIDRTLIRVYRFSGTNGSPVDIVKNIGLLNYYEDSVDFVKPIHNSLITYNGVDHEFIVEDDNAITYPKSAYSVNYVANDATVISFDVVFEYNSDYIGDEIKTIVLNTEIEKQEIINTIDFVRKYNNTIFYVKETNDFSYYYNETWSDLNDKLKFVAYDNSITRTNSYLYFTEYKIGYYAGDFNIFRKYDKNEIVSYKNVGSLNKEDSFAEITDRFLNNKFIEAAESIVQKYDLIIDDVTASSYFSDLYLPNQALNKDLNTCWASVENIQPNEEYLLIDLNVKMNFDMISILYDVNCFATDFTIQVSSNNENWLTVSSYSTSFDKDFVLTNKEFFENNSIAIKLNRRISARYIKFTFNTPVNLEKGIRVRNITLYDELTSYYRFFKDYTNDELLMNIDIEDFARLYKLPVNFNKTLVYMKYEYENYLGKEVKLYDITDIDKNIN